jgi:transposase
MRKIREVLRLAAEGRLTQRQIAAATGMSRATVQRCIERSRAAALSWPLPDDVDDRSLEIRLFGRPAPRDPVRPLPEWESVHRELRRKGMTLMLLCEEYRERVGEGAYEYSQFCLLYRQWQRHLDAVMRQEHRAGEKLFVDFAGQTLPITDPKTGEVRQCQVFVAVLGASNYTYAEALPSQELRHWIGAHVRALEFIGGVPELVVPDCLRSGVSLAHRYDPAVNRTYAEMAVHYQTAVLPARPRKPRDKAKVEVGVQIVERWILARLRHRVFFSLAEANLAIRELLEWLNQRPFRKLAGNRRQLYEEIDRPALQPLPEQRYEFAVWKLAKVNIDYHLEVERHWYSVPFQLIGQVCDVRSSDATVEIFCRGRRVASHRRSSVPYKFTTDPQHMPQAHRRHAEWKPSRMISWAEQTGPATGRLVAGILERQAHPEHGYRACLGVIRLDRRYGAERMESAARYAISVGAYRLRSLESIVKSGLDLQPLPGPDPDAVHTDHANLRGPAYYQ